MKSQFGLFCPRSSLLEECLRRPADDDARSAAAAGVILPPGLVMVVALGPHDRRRRLGQRSGPGVEELVNIKVAESSHRFA